jgi:hypothetical protein
MLAAPMSIARIRSSLAIAIFRYVYLNYIIRK